MLHVCVHGVLESMGTCMTVSSVAGTGKERVPSFLWLLQVLAALACISTPWGTDQLHVHSF